MAISVGRTSPTVTFNFASSICLQIFRHICPEIPCQTQSMPAEFLNNLPKNLTAHLTYKLCAVLPLLFYELFWTDAAIIRCGSRSPQRYRSFSHPVQQQFDTAFPALVFAALVQLRLNAFSRYLPVRSVLLVKRPFAFENLQ